MTKSQQQIEHIIVTFFEAGIAYLAINQTNLSGNAKLTAIGALGAALSAVYNLTRQSSPTIVSQTVPELPVVIPEASLGGVGQLVPALRSATPPVDPVQPPAPGDIIPPSTNQGTV